MLNNHICILGPNRKDSGVKVCWLSNDMIINKLLEYAFSTLFITKMAKTMELQLISLVMVLFHKGSTDMTCREISVKSETSRKQ
jgi:hypothetical protein